MDIRAWGNAMLAPRRMVQGAIVFLFSGVHFAATIAVGGFIALQHENPDPAVEARLYELENILLQPLGAPLIDLNSSSTLLFLIAGGLNSLLWGLTAYLICYAVFAGLRWGWRWLFGAERTSV
ncbi:hypothetical protein CRI93_11940 [Longimonas halophila]|uniref:Uncharacterized protein n=1 Tax=Longimonas halophila TaxID=1469170 RepID=A0A2H3NME4_9BACT|nr:hypothetical protein [Longimonas halophila]PEN05806.1 hypothetical protein CRI93_11940 [Longimonas halophila]